MATANPPGPPAATQGGPPPQQAPMPPATAALLDALPFTPVPYALRDPPPRPPNAPPGLPLLVCKEHGIDLCKQCGVNFGPINISNLYMPMLARGMVPPPPNVPYPNQAEIIKDLREKGNSEFKAGRFAPAIDLYTESIKRSFQRPPWEMTNFCKEEVTSALLNRSAAFAAQKNWPAAYADANACTQLNKAHPKAYFRKAKALEGLERPEDAYKALMTGLAFAPDNEELGSFAKEIKAQISVL